MNVNGKTAESGRVVGRRAASRVMRKRFQIIPCLKTSTGAKEYISLVVDVVEICS